MVFRKSEYLKNRRKVLLHIVQVGISDIPGTPVMCKTRTKDRKKHKAWSFITSLRLTTYAS